MPVKQLPDFREINADAELEVTAVETVPRARLKLASAPRSYQDALGYKAQRVEQLAQRVEQVIASVGDAETVTPSERAATEALTRSGALILADLACIPTTGMFAANAVETAAISDLGSRLNRLVAALARVRKLPVLPATSTPGSRPTPRQRNRGD